MNNIKYFILLAYLLPFSSTAEDLVDPTRPTGYSASVTQPLDQQETAAKREWTLNTTLFSPYQRIAMINGKRLEVGDTIQGAEVMAIGHQKVNLRLDGKDFTIKLHNSFISNVKSRSQ